MDDFFGTLFLAMLAISHIILLVAVIFALLGYFGKVDAHKAKYFATASKLLLIYALLFVVGLGSCLVVL